MHAVWGDFGSTILLALPIWLIGSAVAYLVVLRLRGPGPALVEVGLVAGTLPWLVMIFWPQHSPRTIEIVPFHDLPTWFDSPGTAVAQLIGNLLVLAAVGFFLPIRFGWAAGLSRILAIAVVVSTTIEVLQWVIDIGRVSSVDDIMVNAAGAVLAAAASRRWWVPDHAERSLSLDLTAG
jgi:VanZ like family